MKKLMIALAAVATAAGLQAATVTWGGDCVSSLATVEYAGYADTGSWYGLYLLSGTADTFAEAFTPGANTFAPMNGSDAVTATLLASHTLTAEEWDAGTFTANYEASAASLNGKNYAIVLFDSSADATQYSVALYTISGLDDAGGAKFMFMDGSGDATLLSTNGTGNDWYAVAPEPTSGLLLLLGMAGLALKRKRA